VVFKLSAIRPDGEITYSLLERNTFGG